MNIELLERVKEKIREHPSDLDMHSYLDKSPCRTTACLGGWAILLDKGKDIKSLSIEDAREIDNNALLLACEVLGLEPNSPTSERLFYLGDWPRSFRLKFQYALTCKKRAEAACQRIDHFIATKGAE